MTGITLKTFTLRDKKHKGSSHFTTQHKATDNYINTALVNRGKR